MNPADREIAGASNRYETPALLTQHLVASSPMPSVGRIVAGEGAEFVTQQPATGLEPLGERTKVNLESIPNLDLMRTCAVLFVLGFHLLLYFQITVPGPLNFHALGQWGVLMFFVHTSFVLALSLERQAEGGLGRQLFRPFIIRRLFRILPLSLFVICSVELCRLPVGHLRNGQFLAVPLHWPGLLANLFLVQNLTHGESATAPLWSLPYEMQMYFLLPALFLFVRGHRTVLPLLGLWLVAFYALRHMPALARYGVPDLIAYVPCFLPGFIAYKFMAGARIRLPAIVWPLALAGITIFYLQSPSDLRGAIGCLLLGFAIPHVAQVSQAGVVKGSQLVARYSYGIYLTHFIALWLAFQAFRGLPSFGQWIAFALLICAIPLVLYHALEAPMIQWGRCLALKLG